MGRGKREMEDASTVLLVDDEPVFLESMSKVLAKRGFRIQTVESGEEALTAIEAGGIDVVVLDQKMPGYDGLTTLEHIRRRFPLLQVIFLSGHADVGTAVEAMERGAVDYLIKPASVDKLCERIRASLARRQVQEAPDRGS